MSLEKEFILLSRIIRGSYDGFTDFNVSSWRGGRGLSGFFYDAQAVPSPKLPFDLYISNFFRIKEWSDNTTTMDHLTTAAGLAAGIGIFDYFGWPIERLWAELPVTRSYDEAITDLYHAQGNNWHPNVTQEVFWDLPVSKNALYGSDGDIYAYFYNAYTNNDNNMM